jgi:hypothetical protein
MQLWHFLFFHSKNDLKLLVCLVWSPSFSRSMLAMMTPSMVLPVSISDKIIFV